MEISHDQVGPDIVVVKLAGRVMMGSESEQITNLVSNRLKRSNRVIIFDLSSVTAIDSTGIGRFISSYHLIAGAKGQMRIAAAPDLLRRVFHVLRLDTVFRFYATVEDACKEE
ncbi:MAG: STAS domain-containing protein [Acidobacteriaceae bacterium]|nr:STAS domain-containing protein [Acidobacteriaceae bacterium]MBV9441303.1 STAS domain-containing protein [Acidobacteriaceae bacterium]